MELRRLRAEEAVAAMGGALLLISLSLPWYSGGTADILGLGTARLDDSFSAWQTFTVVDVLLALAAATAITLLLLATARRRSPPAGTALSALVALAGLGLTVLVTVRALSPPAFELAPAGGTAGVIAFEGSSPAIGLWLGLAGCAGMLVGGCVAARDGVALEARR